MSVIKISSFWRTLCIRFWVVAFSLLQTSCLKTIEAQKFERVPASKDYVVAEDYKLGPNDRITVEIRGDKELSKEYIISPLGILNFPFAGNLNVKGLTVQQATILLKNGLNRYLKNPEIHIAVQSIGSFKVIFSGQFMKPSEQALNMETTVLKGILLAGGPALFATGRIILMRKVKGSSLKRYAFQWDDVVNGRPPYDTFYLENNDIIYAE